MQNNSTVSAAHFLLIRVASVHTEEKKDILWIAEHSLMKLVSTYHRHQDKAKGRENGLITIKLN